MQKNKPNNNSFLNKALIFVSAFVVSSLIIYQFYYYNKVRSLSGGIVASADQLPNTVFSPIMPKHFSGKSYMGNAGLLAAAGDSAKSDFDVAPKENLLSGNGVLNEDFLEELNIGISNKFPNHPPIGFGKLKEGDKVLFSYLFKNILLPQSFTQHNETLEINGKHFRAIRYMGNDSNVFAHNKNGKLILTIQIDNGSQILTISQDSLPHRLSTSSKIDLKDKVIIPEIDFNTIKYWKPEEANFLANAKDYKQLEERLKIKVSALQKRTENADDSKAVKLLPPFYMYLYKKGANKPYLMLYVADTELLLPAKK